MKYAESNTKLATVFFEYTNFKDELIKYKCQYCNKNYQEKFEQKFKKPFFNTYKFSNQNNKFILLFRKDVYPYEYLNDGKNSIKHYYLKKKIFTII